MELNFCYGCMEPLEQGVTLCSRCGYDNSQPQNPDDLLPEGTILNGKYLIGKVLGRGGFGVTYLGLELNLLIKVAIKEYFPVGVGIRSPYSLKVKTASSLSNPEDFQTGLTEFLKEARTLASFNSPYFVHVREFFNENGTAYIVMDFVEGTGLDKEIGSCGKMPWERVLSLMKPLMLELDKMHKLGLIHRDIKPGNIRISKDKNTGEDRLILLDFGSARHFVSQNVTKTYTAMITSGFSPLEQYSERSRQGPYTDIYAVCATIYAALTGVVPPAATDRVSGEVDIQPFSSFGVNVPEKIEKAISHGLAVKGADRPRTMKELYDELTEDTPDSEPEHKKSDNVPEKKPTSGSKKLWIYGLILAALAIGLVFIFNGKTNNNTALHTAQTDGLIELTNDTEKQKATEASIKNTPSPGQIQSSDNNSRQSDEIHKSETAVMEQTRIAETNTQDAVLSAEQTRTAGTSTQQALLLEEEIKIAQTGTLEALFAEQTQIAGTSTQQAMFAEQTQIAGTSTQQAVFAVQTQIAGTSTQQTVFSEQTQIAGTSTQQAMFAEQTKIAGTSTQQAVFAEQTQIAGTSTQQAVFAEQTQIAGTSTQQAVFAEQTKNAEVKTQEAIRFEQTEIVREETITAMNAMQTQIAGTQNAIHERETADVVNTQQSANYMAMTVVAEKQSTLEALNTKAAERTSTPLPPTNTPKPAATKTPVPTQKPTATPTRSKTRPSVGSYIVFGSYEQDNNRSNGKESIRWKVLSVEGNKALLLSSYILDAQQFHNSGEIGGGWASSKLRSWMMNDFYNAAFSSNEKKAILTIGQRATSKDTTDDYDTVFILSTDQVKKYLTKTSERQFMATTYAIRARKVFRGADGYYNWWTRSNHIESGSFWKDKIDIVRKYGEIAYTNPTDADCGILPAVWIDINQYMNL